MLSDHAYPSGGALLRTYRVKRLLPPPPPPLPYLTPQFAAGT